MLIRLLPDQITSNWEKLRPAVFNALPPTTPALNTDSNVNILRALQNGKMQMWALKKDAGTEVNAIITTHIVNDVLTGSNMLIIYTLFGVGDLGFEDFNAGLFALKAYCKANQCTKILAYTTNDSIAKLAERLGGNTEWKMLTFNID